MPQVLRDLTGQTFGRLTIIGRADRPPGKSNATWWAYHCTCGNGGKATSQALVRGGVRSCGCFRKERMAAIARANGARAAANARAAKARHAAQEKAAADRYAPKTWTGAESAARNLEAAWSGIRRDA